MRTCCNKEHPATANYCRVCGKRIGIDPGIGVMLAVGGAIVIGFSCVIPLILIPGLDPDHVPWHRLIACSPILTFGFGFGLFLPLMADRWKL